MEQTKTNNTVNEVGETQLWLMIKRNGLASSKSNIFLNKVPSRGHNIDGGAKYQPSVVRVEKFLCRII